MRGHESPPVACFVSSFVSSFDYSKSCVNYSQKGAWPGVSHITSQVLRMSAVDTVARVFRRCAARINHASMILLPVFFTLSFVMLGALRCFARSSTSCISIIFTAMLLLLTRMLFVDSHQYKQASIRRVVSMPLIRFMQPLSAPVQARESDVRGREPLLQQRGSYHDIRGACAQHCAKSRIHARHFADA